MTYGSLHGGTAALWLLLNSMSIYDCATYMEPVISGLLQAHSGHIAFAHISVIPL